MKGLARAAQRWLGALAIAAGPIAAAGAEGPKLPFVIAPVIEGLMACDPNPPPQYREMAHERSACARHARDGAKALEAVLEELEPGGPAGAVQVGYTLTVHLLGLYVQRGADWEIDDSQVDRILNFIRRVPRPVVLYLASNHFDTSGPLTAHLLADARNLMQMAGGSVPHASYYGHRVVPYTLLTDESIPVNRYRFAALRHVARRVAELPPEARARVVAVTLAGEVHHMFPDFEGGMGRYAPVRVTDYSPASVAGFRRWLQAKYGTVAALQAATGAPAGSFDAVTAPGVDLLAKGAGERSEHYDGHADGRVPVAGWLWDPRRRVTALELLVDRRRVATMPRDFNRLDVYRTIGAVDDPSIGFRHDLDYSGWAPGRYFLQVVARTDGGSFEVARRLLEVVTAPGRPGLWMRLTGARGTALPLEPMPAQAGIRASLDLPQTATLRVLFNPLARDWDEYRAAQVTGYFARFHAVAREAGLPAGTLHSHQIVPRVNSSWNPQFFAVDASLDGRHPWKIGFNAYGGAAGGGWTERFVQEQGLTGYGVPEFHPQQWKKPDAATRALALHQRLGARFVGPYYMSVVSDREARPTAAVQQLEIRPNNPQDGSDQLYRAIREAARQ